MPGSRWRHSAGRLLPLALLITGLVSGCSLARGNSSYQVQIPVPHALPKTVRCVTEKDQTERDCVLILEEDFDAIVRELKSACLALRGTDEQCQTAR